VVQVAKVGQRRSIGVQLGAQLKAKGLKAREIINKWGNEGFIGTINIEEFRTLMAEVHYYHRTTGQRLSRNGASM
jgi:hypothetical protein